MRVYTVQFNAVAVTAQQDFFELVAGTNVVIVPLRLRLSQVTEVGDTMEEGLAILVKSGQTVSGSGGSSYTPVPVDFGDAASGSTAEINNTTKANTGTIVTHLADNWNIRAPFEHIWLPEDRLYIRPARRLTVELATTPADSITMSGFLTFGEMG